MPDATLEDWVTYADHVVVATVKSVTKVRETAEEAAIGEGLRIRMVQLAVNKVVWSANDAAPAPEVINIPQGAWSFHADTESRLYLEDSVDLEAGHA